MTQENGGNEQPPSADERPPSADEQSPSGDEKPSDGDTLESIPPVKEQVTPRFTVGLTLHLDIAQKTRRIRVKAHMLGWYRPYMLMITVPLLDARILIVPTGTKMVVRYLLDGNVYGFVTRLINKQHDPAPMWTLEYPDSVEMRNLRSSQRVHTLLQATTDRGDECLILDCSTSGALITVDRNVDIGEHIGLNFKLPDGAEIIDLHTNVIRKYETKVDKTIGVIFSESSDEQARKIQGYIDQCAKYHRGGPPAEFDLVED